LLMIRKMMMMLRSDQEGRGDAKEKNRVCDT
jgi:hypothetical protein